MSSKNAIRASYIPDPILSPGLDLGSAVLRCLRRECRKTVPDHASCLKRKRRHKFTACEEEEVGKLLSRDQGCVTSCLALSATSLFI